MSIKTMSAVWQSAELSGGDLLLLLALADFADDDGVCWPGVEALAAKARIGKRHVYRELNRLAEAGYVKVEHGAGPRGTNRYTVAPRGCSNSTLSHESQGGAPQSAEGVTPRAPDPSSDPSGSDQGVQARPRVRMREEVGLIQEMIGTLSGGVTEAIMDRVDKGYTAGDFAQAIAIARENDAGTWAYVRAILDDREPGFASKPTRRGSRGRQRNTEHAGRFKGAAPGN